LQGTRSAVNLFAVIGSARAVNIESREDLGDRAVDAEDNLFGINVHLSAEGGEE
jgi:hypothetical protein